MTKTALVTGASTGIGYELCRLLAKDGYSLYLVARDAAKLAETAARMEQAGSPKATVIVADLSRADSVARVVEALGPIVPDVLVNNAGFGMLGSFADSDFATQMEMIQLNVTSLVELTHRMLPGMVRRRGGRILNIASTAAFQPGPLMAVYYATKAFVLHFSEAIAEELRATGVSVTVLCPGPTDTEFQERAKMADTKLFKGGLRVMAASEVAAIGYKALMAGKTLSIAGLGNLLGMESLRLAPRSIVRKMIYKLQS